MLKIACFQKMIFGIGFGGGKNHFFEVEGVGTLINFIEPSRKISYRCLSFLNASSHKSLGAEARQKAYPNFFAKRFCFIKDYLIKRFA